MTAVVMNDLAEAFKQIDVDGSGSVSKEELRSHLSGQQGINVSKNDFDLLFGIIDKDNSGSIDLAEYSLFIEQVHKLKGEKRRRSSMKVPTQKDSLKTCDRPQLKKKKGNKNSRSSRLLSTRHQDNFHGKSKLDTLDTSPPKIAPEISTTIRYFDVEVREYGIAVSDNPGVKKGVAVELSWDYNVLEHEHIDTYEARRCNERSKNFMKEKKLTRLEREKILKQFGATEKEIQEASKRAATIRNGRKKSISMRQHDKFHEDVESRLSLIKKFFRHKSKAKNETEGIERLHPTLMAMIDGGSQISGQSSNAKGP